MQRSEILLAAVLAVLVLTGTVYETVRGAGKTAKVVITRPDVTPFDAESVYSADAAAGAPVRNGTAAAVAAPAVKDPSHPLSIITHSTPYTNDTLLTFLNHATLQQLDALDGIGEKTAQKILEKRAQLGLFRTQDQVLEISGIGEAKLKSMRDQVLLSYHVGDSGIEVLVPTLRLPGGIDERFRVDLAPVPRPTRPPRSNLPVDLNRATLDDLMAVPGIGQHTAELILKARQGKQGFKSWSEVDEIPGLGEKRILQLQERFFLRDAHRR